jgi:signal transduction histidine kinase
MSLRWRLTLYYSALSAFIVVLSGVAFFVVLRQSLQTALDTSLHEVAELAANQRDGDADTELSEAETNELLEQLAGNTTLVAYNAQEQEMRRVGQIRLMAPLVEGFSTVSEHRVYTLHLTDGHWIQVIRSQVETLQAIGRAQRLLPGGLPFLLLIGFGIGYFLADGALKPVDRVTSLAERIATSGHFKERVPETPGNDEMARLTQTFNHMLAQLETTLEREKAFALAAAHELRTPLAFLQGRASLSLEKPRSVEQYQRDLTQIHATSQQMTQMVDSLLLLARTNQTLQRDPVAVAKLLGEVAVLSQDEAKKHSMTLSIIPSEAVIHGDHAALRLALGNLVQNAIKYGRAGGHVWLRGGRQNNEVFLEVCDDGPGIPEADLERLRQPFQRGLGLQSMSGSGLGLALVAAIAEQHKGRLELSRASQGGLRAALWLPKDNPQDVKGGKG